jgi:hypothetical protein
MNRGHLLVELLICLVIIGFVAPVLLPAAVGAYRAAQRVKHRSRATNHRSRPTARTGVWDQHPYPRPGLSGLRVWPIR